MSNSSKKRYRANEILSATLIELLLLIAFVLLLVIFIDNNQESSPLEKKRVCNGLLVSLEPLVGSEALIGIDCDEYEKHAADLLERIILAAKLIDQNQKKLWVAIPGVTNYPPIGTTAAGIALDNILSDQDKKGGDLQRINAGLNAKNAQLQREVSDLSSALALGDQAMLNLKRENSEIALELKKTQLDIENIRSKMEAVITENNRLSGTVDGLGSNSGVGPCLTSNPQSLRPSHDYLVVVDLRGSGYEVSLRADTKHSIEIMKLLDNNIIAKELGMDRVVTYSTTQDFVSAFSELKAHAQAQKPKCGYQARVLIDEMSDSTWKKLEDGVREAFLSTEKVVSR